MIYEFNLYRSEAFVIKFSKSYHACQPTLKTKATTSSKPHFSMRHLFFGPHFFVYILLAGRAGSRHLFGRPTSRDGGGPPIHRGEFDYSLCTPLTTPTARLCIFDCPSRPTFCPIFCGTSMNAEAVRFCRRKILSLRKPRTENMTPLSATDRSCMRNIFFGRADVGEIWLGERLPGFRWV